MNNNEQMEQSSKYTINPNEQSNVSYVKYNTGHWLTEEHESFLRGVSELGKGMWSEIADKYVKTRSRVQVASHAQKYFGSNC